MDYYQLNIKYDQYVENMWKEIEKGWANESDIQSYEDFISGYLEYLDI